MNTNNIEICLGKYLTTYMYMDLPSTSAEINLTKASLDKT